MDLEITAEEINGIDVNNIASMQLKDGTTIVISGGEQIQAEGELVEQSPEEQEVFKEEHAEEIVENVENEENVEGQENQLRARPVPGKLIQPVQVRPGVVPVRPALVPMKPTVVPGRPVPIKPAVVPVPVKPGVVPMRPGVAPMRPPVVGPKVFRARPGMPVHRPPVAPVVKPGHMGAPIHRPGIVPVVKPVPMVVPMNKPGMARPMPIPVKPVFRARPNVEQEEEFEEEEYDYQQEEVCGEDQYCECGQEEDLEEQFRARPMVMAPPRPVPMVTPPRPRVVPVPVAPMPPKRGPMPGYNTFQPRVFRARPRVMPVPAPVFTPMTTYSPMVQGHHVKPRGPMGRPMPMMKPGVFRGKEISRNVDDYEQQCEECQNQCTKSVCTRCGKEF